MSPTLKHSTLTKREVIEILGKSKRTVETYIAEGRLPVSYFNGTNGKQAYFEKADVERLKREFETPMVRTLPAVSNDPGKVLARIQPGATELAQAIAAALRDGLQGDSPKPWLTISEAVEYSGLPRSYLLAQARAGAVRAVNVGTGKQEYWRFNREALAK